MEDVPNYGNARIAKSNNLPTDTVTVSRTIDGCWVVTVGRDTDLSVNPHGNRHYSCVDASSVPSELRQAWLDGTILYKH